MTGAIIVYDHTNGCGAFCSKSEIKVSGLARSDACCPGCCSHHRYLPQIKRCLKELAGRHTAAHGATATLLDTIRFSSAHFNDDDTPDRLRSIVSK